jgi:hypothetical protein
MCLARFSLISRSRGYRLRYAGFRVQIPIVLTAVAQKVSRNRQLSHAAHAGDFAARQIAIKILEVLPKIFERIALRPVVGVFFEISQPRALVLPIDIAGLIRNSHAGGGTGFG